MSNLSSCYRRVIYPAFASVCLLLLNIPFAANGQTTPFSTSDPDRLELNGLVERTISGGQKHAYVLELSADEFAAVQLEQKGIDVYVKLIDKDGVAIAEFDSETRPIGFETIEVVSLPAGSYRLEVEPRLKTAASGQYAIRWTERRPSTQNDKALQEARTLADKSRALDRAGKYKEALEIAQQVLSIRESILGPDSVEVGVIVNRIGNLYSTLSDGLTAETFYERALRIYTAKFGPDHILVSQVLNNIAVLHRIRGDLIGAEQMFLRAIEIKEKALGPNDLSLAPNLNNLGILYRRLGDNIRAEESYQRALTIREKALGPNHLDVGNVLVNLAALRFYNGDYTAAIEFGSRALAIKEKTEGPEHPNVAYALDNLANTYISAGEYEKARPLTERAIAIWEKRYGTDSYSFANFLSSLARLYMESGETSKARPLLERAVSISEKDTKREDSDFSSHLLQLGTLETSEGRFGEAEPHLFRALSIREKTFGAEHQSIGRVCSALGKMFLLKGDLGEALKYQTCSARINDRNIELNLAVGSEHQKLTYLSQLSDDLDQTIALSISPGPQSSNARRIAASEIVERKGRVLDTTAATLAVLRRSLKAEDKLLIDRLSKINGALADLSLSRPSNLSGEAYDTLLSDLKSKKDSLERDIASRSRGSYSASSAVKLEDVQKLIPANSALIEYAVYRPAAKSGKNGQGVPRYAGFVIDRNGVAAAVDLGAASDIDGAASSLRAAFRDPKRNDYVHLSRVLEAKIVGPMRSLIQNSTHLIISPDSELNLVPFEALYDAKNQPLVANHLISYVTSGRDLARMEIKRESKSGPAIVADPMFEDPAGPLPTGSASDPSAKTAMSKRRSSNITRDIEETYFAPLSSTAREAESIRNLFPESKVFTGARATETAVKEFSAPKILHIATHGFFLQEQRQPTAAAAQARNKIENPLLRSGLALAGANRHLGGGDDGMFTALEASGLDLWGTKLVVLSACDTGLGDVRTGEGVYGLRRAIAIAGAESLVMSLWPVSDFVTRELMTNYYANLKKGLGRGEALRQVQLQMLKNPNRKHPFYWASFIQAGEWADLDGKR